MACFTAVVEAGCTHKAIIAGSGSKAARAACQDPAFKWVNTALGNIKAALVGHIAPCVKSTPRVISRLAVVALTTAPMPYRMLKLADVQA